QFNKVFLNDGHGSFDKGQNIGVDLVAAAQKVDLADPVRVVSALLPDLTMAIAVKDLDGDTYPDVIAGNLGQPNRIYFNDGTGKFLPAVELGAFELTVGIDPRTTADNNSADDLLDDLRAAVASALTTAGLNPDDVTVDLDESGRVTLRSPHRV